MIIGVTGPSGAGKSTVCEIFRSKGAYIINADKIGHEVLEMDDVKKNLLDSFGDGILDARTGRINRSALADKVFTSSPALNTLNHITHPKITATIKRHMADSQLQGYDVCVIDAALLWKSGLDSLCDKILYITAPCELLLNRITERDNLTVTQAERRLAAQEDVQKIAREQTLSGKCMIIYNDGGLETLENKVRGIV